MPSTPLVRVMRSGLEESLHLGDVAVVGTGGRLVASAGNPDRRVFPRSCMKPLQAAVSLSLAPFDFSAREVAVMSASHNAEPPHVAAVRSLLARVGVEEARLRCPAVRPWDERAAMEAPERLRVNSDCSGKHAGMLAACRAQGWQLESYRDVRHPLQQAILGAVREASDQDPEPVGVDGCGVPVHGLRLVSLARIYSKMTRPASLGGLGREAKRVVASMREEPYMVAGRNRVDTAVMQTKAGAVVKAGAEGLLCAALLGPGLGVAVKVGDGAARAVAPALIHVLSLLGELDEAQLEELAPYGRPAVLGGGERVGELVPMFELRMP